MKKYGWFWVITLLFLIAKADASSYQHVLVGFSQTSIEYITQHYPVTVLETYDAISVASLYAPLSTVQQLKNDPNLSFVSFNQHIHLIEEVELLQTSSIHTTSLPALSNQDAYEVMNIEQAHNSGLTGKNVSICIVDSGIDASHPSLQENIAGTATFIQDSSGRNTDEDGHGTHVAGIIVGLTPAPKIGSYTFNISGVAPDAKLYSAKVLNEKEGLGDTRSLLGGINWCVKQNVDIINMSLGYDNPDPAIESALQIARDKGILNVASSGNEKTHLFARGDYVNYPARLPTVLAIGSVDVIRKNLTLSTPISTFSNTGPSLSFVAPGKEIVSAFPNQQAAILNGTSMATPMVSGLAALYQQENPNGTPDILTKRLQQSSKDLGNRGKDHIYGHGLATFCQLDSQWTSHQPTFTFKRSENQGMTTLSWNRDPDCGVLGYHIYVNGILVKRTMLTSYRFETKLSSTYRIQIAVVHANKSMSQKSKPYSFRTKSISFKDVNSNHWAHQAIVFVSQKKWINGMKDGTFRPSKGVTRAEAAITLSRMLPSKKTYRKQAFSDVPRSHYAYDAIMKMAQANVMVGNSPTRFSPNQVMTREELTVILARLVKEKTTIKGTSSFTDVKNPKRYSYNSILSMKKLGYVAGCTSTKFCPTKTISRAEFAALLSRMGMTIQERNN